jgi:hypothetical protein
VGCGHGRGREGRGLRLGAGVPGGGVEEAFGDAETQPRHRNNVVRPLRIALPIRPLQVPDHRLGAPVECACQSGRRPHHGLHLHGGPRVLAVAEVLALEAVEAGVAVDRPVTALVFVRGGGAGAVVLGDHRGEDVGVAAAGVVGPAVADEVDGAVSADDAVAEGSGEVLDAVEAHGDGRHGLGGDGVVEHDAVDGAPLADVVAVVGAPSSDLDHFHPLIAESLDDLVGGKWRCHGGPLSLGPAYAGRPQPGGRLGSFRVSEGL